MLLVLPNLLLFGCGGAGDDDSGSTCGPSSAVVDRVIDGDTIDLVGGERVRYLLIDTPEVGDNAECWGAEATQANRDLVDGVAVQLTYDLECRDVYGRLLAYVTVGNRVINEVLLERGHACVLHIPPNGADLVADYMSIEAAAQAANKGLWGSCPSGPCD